MIQGHALETESCGVVGGWDCQYYQDVGGGEVPADREEVRAEVGPGCRCGCIVHLSKAKPHRIVAASAHSCPGRSFWLIQTERGERVKVGLEQLRLGCLGQGLRLRDGDSTQAPLLAHLTGAPPEVSPVLSSGPSLLVEFTAGDVLAAAQECNGGFLAHATQIGNSFRNKYLFFSSNDFITTMID
ncbi:hypothetical protein AAG570_009177 [Ranatra chinensis]|uniref:CUB domain-containing protein n=1 Tax=Ranatra chinensis TaxID=642074 RepID=A0ABD0Z5V1_9HEMI